MFRLNRRFDDKSRDSPVALMNKFNGDHVHKGKTGHINTFSEAAVAAGAKPVAERGLQFLY